MLTENNDFLSERARHEFTMNNICKQQGHQMIWCSDKLDHLRVVAEEAYQRGCWQRNIKTTIAAARNCLNSHCGGFVCGHECKHVQGHRVGNNMQLCVSESPQMAQPQQTNIYIYYTHSHTPTRKISRLCTHTTNQEVTHSNLFKDTNRNTLHTYNFNTIKHTHLWLKRICVCACVRAWHVRVTHM